MDPEIKSFFKEDVGNWGFIRTAHYRRE